ncbi:MAG: AtpZ/AtpI family protein, partial [Elusimicrobia bacterium]|nr:AtpZ/AtpI family protein [Elusimicrobiota bacterium]
MEPTKDPGEQDPKLALGTMLAAGMQLAVSVVLGVFVGYRLDARFKTSPWFT